uniref:NADH-ubiquinone oxidoreductase chain 2 n=1 Tax=Archaeocroton sphenodonti TaxID=2599316 RepID=H9M786_9ACAR|nr:NADH dehydrogenase subunit 2 [Archaeocroton sphenodonti]AET63103.1 NADH dehydrogenase subunit 2 [Archaeocroton sphenodonti]
MFFKKLMMWMIMITIMITISSNFWFTFWLMMEINLMVFIPLMNSKNLMSCNAMITYFIIQSFSSSLFFMGSLLILMNFSMFFKIIINIAIMIKLAMIPFHFWITMISESLDLFPLFIILTFQKMIPLIILTKCKSEIVLIFGMISSVFGSIMALNSKLLKKIMIFSSISHMGWMTILIFIQSNFWVFYLILYILIFFKIFNILKKNHLISMSNLMFKKINTNMKLLLISMMLSLGGMPPFLGFFMKLMSIFFIIKVSLVSAIILAISSLVNIYFYVRIFLPMYFINIKHFKMFNINKMMKSFFVNLNIILTILILNMMT